MRRGYAWILALLLVLTLLTGCGGSGGDNAASEAAAGETVESTASDAAGGSWGAWPEESPAAPAAEGATGGEDRLADAKMIYTGHMEVETTAFEDAVSGLERLVEEMGGYFERAAVHDYGGYRSARLHRPGAGGAVPGPAGPGGGAVPRHLPGAEQR